MNKGETNFHDKEANKQVAGVATASGIAGFLVAGPVAGVAAAGGTAYLAHKKKGKAGELARDCGSVVAKAGDKIKKFEKKHHVTQKTMRGFSKGLNWASKKLDKEETADLSRETFSPTKENLNKLDDKNKEEKIKVGDLARDCENLVAKAGNRMKHFDEKHRVTEKTFNGISKGLNWASKKLDDESPANSRTDNAVAHNSNSNSSSKTTNRENNVSSLAKDCGDVMIKAGNSMKNFDEKHQVTKKTYKGIKKGLNWVSQRLDSTDSNKNIENCHQQQQVSAH